MIILVIVVKSINSFFLQLSNEQVKIVNQEKFESKETKNGLTQIDNKLETSSIKNKEQKEKEKLKSDKLKEEKLAKEKLESDKLKEEKLAKEKLESDKFKEEKLAKEKLESDKLKGKYPFIKFYPVPKVMFTSLPNAPENKNKEIFPDKFRNATLAGQENVYIKAHSGDTWISYQADEDKIKRFVLKQGRSVLIKAEKILLFMGNVSAAKIFYNNQLIKTPTKSGVKSLIFPQSLASEYKLPLFPSYKGIPIKAALYKENMVSKE